MGFVLLLFVPNIFFFWCLGKAVLRDRGISLVSSLFCKINVKKIAFGNKEHTTDKKMGVSVLLRLFISSNGVCNTAYTL